MRNHCEAKYKLSMNSVYSTLLLLVFFPIFSVDEIDPVGFEPLPEYSYSKLIRVAWVLLVMATCTIILNKRDTNWIKPSCKYYDNLLIVYILFATLSILVNTPTRFVAWYRLFELIIFYLSSVLIAKHAIYRYGYKGSYQFICSGILVSCAISLFVLFSLGVIDIKYAILSGIQGRNRLGGYCYSSNALSILFILSQISTTYFYKINRLRLSSFIVLTIIMHFSCYYTGSRTGLAILLFSDLVLLFKLKILSKKYVYLTSGFTILVLFSFIVYLINTKDYYDFFSQILGSGEDPITDLLTLNNRVSIYLVAFEGIIQKPLLGYGYVDGVRQYLANNYTLDFWLPPHTHNSIIEILLAQGVLGGFSFLVFIGTSLILSTVSIFKSVATENIVSSVAILSVFLSALTSVPLGNAIINIGNIFIVLSYIQYANYKQLGGGA